MGAIPESNQMAKRTWKWFVVLWAILLVFPIEYQATRLLLIAGAVLGWVEAMCLWWQAKLVRAGLVAMTVVFAAIVSLPGRPVKPESLGADYCHGLRLYRGVRYVWGGEGFLGIDCSGLVRKGFVWGQLLQGMRTFNGTPIREALVLWWRDASAKALRDGIHGYTRQLFSAESIAKADHSRLRPGDLAVTADGIHIMAYLGNGTWIEADPTAHRVIEITLPTTNQWFRLPVVFLRWTCFDGASVPSVKAGERVREFEERQLALFQPHQF